MNEATQMGMANWITIAIAIYGAVIATFTALWRVYDWRQGQVHIKVEANLIISASGRYLGLTALNTGKVPVHLTSAGFQLEDKSSIVPCAEIYRDPSNRLPLDLLPGRSFTAFVAGSELLRDLEKGNHGRAPRNAWFSDAIGRIYKKKLNGRRFMDTLKRVAESENYGFGPLRDPTADQ